MAKCTNFPAPIVRRGAGFHANQTRRQLGKELQNLGPAELATDDRLTLRIDGMDLKHVLGQIEADNNNLLGHGTTPLDVASYSRILYNYLGAGPDHPITSQVKIGGNFHDKAQLSCRDCMSGRHQAS